MPKLVARPRPKGKQFSLDFEPLAKAYSPIIPQPNNLLPAIGTSGETAAPTRRDKPLIHARSLDDLLANSESPVIVELTQNKKSKYSRVVITASTYTLNEEPQLEEAENSENLPPQIVTGIIMQQGTGLQDNLGWQA